tara:strand:- start:632 stop:817 length:186 start_codon:yes stop_codon:yes gene_type:complete
MESVMLVFEVFEGGILKVSRYGDLCEFGYIIGGQFYAHQQNKNMNGASSSDLRQIADKLDE